MAIRNTLKLLLNDFSNIWKILLYKLIIFLISLGLIVGLVLPNVITIINNISETGLFNNLNILINDFFTRGFDITVNLEAFKTSLENSSAILYENADKLMLSYIYIILIIVIINFMSGLSELTISDIINADMSANAKYNFSSRFIITFGSNIKYQFIRHIIEIPVYLLIMFAVWNIFSFLLPYIGIFSMFFAFIAMIILVSLTQTFFCCQLPEITVKQSNILNSIRIGFKLVKPNFSMIFSSFIFIDISIFFVNIMLAFFTCGAGLLISIPMSNLFMIIYRLVTYYEINSLKYYVDNNTIIVPKNNYDI